ncbi:MAG TPA: hypothetical protein VEG34_00625 [Thermoanaerobaculia bacterium]|nr:hypothetical protein [Thermoanaerobaculia bacterium]
MATQRRLSRLGGFLLPLLTAVVLLTAAPLRAEIPWLEIEAPPELAGQANRLRELEPREIADALRLAGIDEPGVPIRVILAPEGTDLARSAPPWVSGWAWPQSGTIVLLPQRSPSYPADSLEDLLRHEVAHVLIGRAAGGRPVPRWFHEGVALVAGDSWGLDDRSRLAVTVLRRRQLPLPELERRFAGGRGQVEEAYAIAGGLVQDLLQRHGAGVTGEILAGLAEGLTFEAAFERAAGEPLAVAEAVFWEEQTSWSSWFPALTSPLVVWGLIALLAGWARRRKQQRAAALHRRWEEEERAASLARAPEPGGDRETIH